MFGWGIALGLLLGAALTSGYFWPQLQEVRAKAQEARELEEWRSREDALFRRELDTISIDLKRDIQEFEARKKAIRSH
jgi:hypothetical protein